MKASAPRPHIPPRFRITQIAERMARNDRNHLWFRRPSGQWVQKPYQDLEREIRALIATLEQRGFVFGEGRTIAIMGKSNFEWLLAALACIFTGTRIVAVPETLPNRETAELLAPFPLDGAIVAETALSFDAFAQVPRAGFATLEAACAMAPPAERRALNPWFRLLAFTSGSTSAQKMKAFWCEAEGTEVYIESLLATFGLTSEDTWAVCHTFSHIVHLEKVLGGLVWGYNLALFRPTDLLARPRHIAPAGFTTVPAVWEEIAEQLRQRFPSHGWRARLIALMLKLPVNAFTFRLARAVRPFVFSEVEELLGDRLKVGVIGTAPSKLELKRFLARVGVPAYEGYGMSEVGLIASNTPGEYRFGSVGKAAPGVGIATTGSGELWVSTAFRRTSRYENVDESENAAVFKGDKLLCTGDLGRIDGDGYLFIEGRVKTLIVTNRGEKINPVSIELRLQEIPGVAHAVVFGDNQAHLAAVLSPQAGRPLSLDDVWKHLPELNGSLATSERIDRVVIAAEPFSADNGLLTRVGKPSRKAIWERYGCEVDATAA